MASASAPKKKKTAESESENENENEITAARVKRQRNGSEVAYYTADADEQNPLPPADEDEVMPTDVGTFIYTSPDGNNFEADLAIGKWKFKTSDGEVFDIKQHMVGHYGVIKNLVEDAVNYDILQTSDILPIKLPNVTGSTFTKVNEYFSQRSAMTDEKERLQFDFSFAKELVKNREEMFRVFYAANYLNCVLLLNLLRQQISYEISSLKAAAAEVVEYFYPTSPLGHLQMKIQGNHLKKRLSSPTEAQAVADASTPTDEGQVEPTAPRMRSKPTRKKKMSIGKPMDFLTRIRLKAKPKKGKKSLGKHSIAGNKLSKLNPQHIPADCIVSIFMRLRGDELLNLYQGSGWEMSEREEDLRWERVYQPSFIDQQSKDTVNGFLHWHYNNDLDANLPKFLYASQRHQAAHIDPLPISLPDNIKMSNTELRGSNSGIILLSCKGRLALANPNLGTWVYLPVTMCALRMSRFGLTVTPAERGTSFVIGMLTIKSNGCYFSTLCSALDNWVEAPQCLSQYGLDNHRQIRDVPVFVGGRFYWHVAFRRPKCFWFEPKKLLCGDLKLPASRKIPADHVTIVDIGGILGCLMLKEMDGLEIFRLQQNGIWLGPQTCKFSLNSQFIAVGRGDCTGQKVRILGFLDNIVYIQCHDYCFCFGIDLETFLAHVPEVGSLTRWYPHKSTLVGCPTMTSFCNSSTMGADPNYTEGG